MPKLSEDEWEVWYHDMFDRDAPPSMDVSGRGLVRGLTELWARFLFESITVRGELGFSRFQLRWQERTVSIMGDREGAGRLRSWLFGQKETADKGYVEEAAPELLNKISQAHSRLVDQEQVTEQLLALALAAKDHGDFASRLDDLIRKQPEN